MVQATDTNNGAKTQPDTGLRKQAGDVLQDAREKTVETYQAAREKTAETYQVAREKSAAAYETAREKASQVGRRTATGIDENPVIALVGGLVLGAVLGAVLPRSRREEEALSGVGEKLRNAAGDAGRAAKDAGTSKLDELGLNRDAAAEKVKTLVDGAVAAVGSAGSAAAQAVKQPGTQG